MTTRQRDSLWKVISEYVEIYRPELAEEDLNKIRSGGYHLVHFAWIGSDKPGQPHYYRIQGPTFILEYDNTQNDANHVNVLWRDFENDFGADIVMSTPSMRRAPLSLTSGLPVTSRPAHTRSKASAVTASPVAIPRAS